MRKFGSLGLKTLKMLHILMIVLFLGGILSSFALLTRLDPSNFDDVNMAYRQAVSPQFAQQNSLVERSHRGRPRTVLHVMTISAGSV
jgi:hypothetical protein